MLLLVIAIGGVGVKVALSEEVKNDTNFLLKSTIHVYPSSVGETSWSGTDNVLSPELKEDALYQKFSAKNSAYIPLNAVIINDDKVTSVVDQPQEVHEVTSEIPSTPDIKNTEAQDENAENIPEILPQVPDETSVQPQTVAPEAEPVTLKKATASMFTFLGTVTRLFPFAQESAVQDIQPELTGNQTADAVVDTTVAPSSDVPLVENQEDQKVTLSTSSTKTQQEQNQIPDPAQPKPVEPVKNNSTKSITLSDFSTPQLQSGEFITGVQLRMSLGAKYEKSEGEIPPSISIQYKTPSSTELVGTIVLEDEVSNALNGGYFLFALPEVTKISELQDMEITVSYNGDSKNLDGMYLDALWLEVEVEHIDKNVLEEKVNDDTNKSLADPALHTLLSKTVDFTREELPHFSLRYNSQRNIAVRFLRNLFGRDLVTVEEVSFIHNDTGDIGVKPKIDVTEDGLISLSLAEADTERLQPGEYSVELTVNEGGVEYTDSFEFQWGLLSVNSNKTSYKPNQTAEISLGSLSPNGNTVCDAQLQLYIIDPNNTVTKTIVIPSGLCNGNNVVDVPDYGTSFVTTIPGEYEMYLERIDVDGKILSHISDTFLVAETLPLSIERHGPSRIYPKAEYPMNITVHSDTMWSGKLIETVPADFVIGSTSAKVTQKGDVQELTWDVRVDASTTQMVSYTFDAPDISPFLYTVGTARLEGQPNSITIPSKATSTDDVPVSITPTSVDEIPPVHVDTSSSTEPIAPNDQATASTALEQATENANPSTEEPVAPSEPVLEEKSIFEKIIDILPFIGNHTTENTTLPNDENLPKPQLQEQLVAQEVVPLETNESARTSTTIASGVSSVVFTEHRKWQIASDATGSMIAYWTSGASVPAGWTCLSCGSGTFYQKFVRGGATYNSTGGAATQTHNASGTVGSTATANSENRAGTNVAIVSHAHTYTPTITASTSLPAYRQLRVIQNNSAGEPATVPAGVVMMFDSTLPSGWARYTALDNRYPRGENTISNAGTSTHRHTISGSTLAASGSTVDGRAGGTQVTASANTHTHTVSSNTGYVNHEPPYISVIFATSSSATNTPTGAVTMWTDTPPAQWQNASAQVGDAFYNNFIKGSATYGTTGGALTHTHADVTGITSSAAVGTQNARTGATGANSTHTHSVDVTTFTTASNLPPYVTAIFGRKYGAVPLYTQSAYRFYVNANASTPTDPWPVGNGALLENEDIDSSNVPVKNGDVVRIRMQLSVSNSTSTADTFKLQFASTTSTCGAATVWTDVGNATSSALWRGYDNALVADGATLSSSTLSGTDKFESYEEKNPTASTPNTISTSQEGEWDFVVQQNAAYEGATYCFRMVKSAGTVLYAYTQYPTLLTNQAPNLPTLTKLFDNEKVGTTTPDFEFSGSDDESNDLTYQIQVDDDYAFGSVNIDKNSVTNSTQFGNLATPADKDPFTQGETISFNNTTALTNGTTYYWRVRAKDPTGSNTYGIWSTIYSFTIDTTVTLSTWHQTTDEQFNTNTLDGVYGVADQAQLRVGSSTGTMYSDPITFSEGQIGTAWGSFAFADTETSSDLKYTIQYDNAGVWTDIPDTVLSGNTAGFDTSPVSLLGVNKTTYTTLRIKSTFVNAGASPSLQDWTVTWGYLIETPTITAPFANEKVSTTTPTFKFTTTDPQGDSLQYQVQWSSTYAFTASTTRNSNVNAGFSNLTTPADTDPFNSGDNMQFKIQAGDALTNGNTYWWRVRARDPAGSNTYSFFTDPRSITVDTTVTVSTWFQTTQSQFSIDVLSNAYSRATNAVTVATTTLDSLIAYAEGTVTTPRYRTWNGTVWSSESSALDVGATIHWVVNKSSPIESEYILATMGTDADVNVQVYANGSWGHLQEVTTSIANTAMRGFDVAYESLSGDAVVVTCDGDANPTYYTWNGSTWTNGGAVGLVGGNTCGWIKLISDPTSDEIIAITRDTSGITYEARVWNGSSWGNSWRMGSMNQVNHEGIAAEYEESGGQAVIAVSNGTAAASALIWSAWNGSSWSASTTVTLGDDFEAGSMVADDGSDNLALCYVDEDGDIGALRWTGAGWAAAFFELETAWTTAGNVYNDRPVDCAFEVSGARDGYIMAVYSDQTNLRYRYWNGAAWVAEATVSTIGTGPRVQTRRTGNNLIQALEFASTTDRYDYSYWNGTAWSAIQTLETNASVGATPFKEPLMIAPANPTSIGTVVGDPLISFYEGSGPYWQQMSWTDTTTGGSDILYQMQYYNGSTWQLISNTLIPGNSTGTTTSPINLTNVLPAATYNKIRPVANMSCNAGTCPTLSDWTLTWAAGITISGTAKQYDQSSNVTSGTVAVALNGVIQTGKTGTISGGTWSIANVNAAAGDVVTVFVTSAADSAEAVVVSKYDGVGNMSGMNLFERHVSIGSDDLQTISNANLATYDFTNTEDIFYDVNAGNDLTACATTGCNDVEIIIKALNTYQPGSGADVSTRAFENNGTLKLNGNTMTLSGSWDNNATTTMATSSVVFNATSSAKTIDETGAISPWFYNLTIGNATSTAVWTAVTALDINNNLTVTGGTLARGSLAMTIAGNLNNAVNGIWTGIGTTTFDGTLASTWTDSSAALQNIGRVVIDGTIKSVTLGSNVKARSIKIGSDDTLDASVSGYTATVFTNWINNNTFTARTGTVAFAATTTGRIITAGNSNFYNLSFTGAGGAWSFTSSTLGVDNDLTISAAGTVTLPSATTTIAGSFTNSAGTFVHNNGQLYFTSSSAETLTLGGTALTNAFYNARFTGSGSWSFTEANATTSNLFRITQGNVTLPSNTLTIGDTFTNSAGTFTHNSGTVKFINTGTKVIDTNASFYNLRFSGSGSAFSFLDSGVTALGTLTVTAGTLTLPSGTLSLGGSLSNSATLTHNNGTVLFNSTDVGETINTGNSSLYNMTFSGTTGGWTISQSATTTNNTTLTTASAFTMASGKRLSVGAIFTNSVGGASTTWSGSSLVLQAGNYSLNTKTNTGDVYDTIVVKASTNIKMWNSSASTYTVNSTGSLYSQDHAGVDGDLYIYGAYARSSGSEYWSYATDFDGTALGGSSRRTNVKFASGASASFSSSILNVVGISSATTTVDNQGSGTYVVGVSAGTTTAQYYSFTHLGSTGVSLNSANKVTSLANGYFAPGVGGGTGLTISSTTIDRNPALQISNVNFSTTSVIVANNVKQIDGTPASYWWFRSSAGSIDGEANDLDTGNPGSIRWDDSSLVFTVSGTVYADDGVTPLTGGTCNGVATPVRVKVEGGATYDGTCSAVNGTYSIPGVTSVGDPTITVFLNGASGGQKAVSVTKTPTANITNMDLYVNRVIVRHQDVAPMTITDMADYDSTDDADITFTAATGTTPLLTVLPNTELFVWATSTFTPGGTVTLRSGGTGNTYDGSLHIDNAATFTGAGTTTYSIGGSYTQDAGATFTSASSTVLMTATTSGKTISVATGRTATFNLLRFTGVGGGWNLNGNMSSVSDIQIATGTLTGTGNIFVLNGSLYGNGTLSLGSGTTTISKTNTLGGTRAWTFGSLTLGNGLVVGTTTLASTATTTVSGKLTIANAHFLKMNTSVLNLSGTGNVFVETGTLKEDTSTIRYSGTAATNILSTSYYNLELKAGGGTPTYTATGLGVVVLNNLTVGGPNTTTVNFTTNDPALDVNGAVTIASNGTLVGSNSAAFTVAGSWTNAGTYTSSAGTVTFDGAGSPSIDAGSSSFSNLTINGTGSYTVSQNATATAAFSLNAATAFTLASGKTFAVGGVFTNAVGGAATTWTGSTLYLYSATNYQINAKTKNDVYGTLSIAANTDIRMWNSSATVYTVNGTGSLYSQDHSAVDGDVYIYGNYPGNGGTDYWSYATDFDGTALGGSSRQVDVRFISGSSMTLLAGGLQVLGSASASTSLQNQGSGTYGMRIGGNASTSWSYYDVQHTDSSGLTFSGTPNVVTLSRGSYTVTQSGGSAITVGGAVINANAARTFTNNIFATTTAIAAYNVTATGTAVSSWRFTNHTGNIAGETKDNDPAGDPGYLVWDNSAASVSIAGHVYSDEGSTVSTMCDSTTPRIHVRIAGLTSYTTSCSGDGAGGGTGAYLVSGVTFSPGDSLVVYIDGGSAKGATVSEDLISSVANMDIYENRVIVRHEDTDPLSIADMAVWDSSDDADIPFTAVDAGTDTLTLPANRKLLVWASKSFTPAGDVTLSGGGGGSAYDGTLEAQTNAVVTFAGTQQHSIGGSFILGSGATLTSGQSTTTFTTSGAARTIDINNGQFYNVAFTGSGSWSVTDNIFSVKTARISSGAVTLPTGTTTVRASWNTVGGSFVVNGSKMVFTASSSGNVVRGNGSNFAEMVFNGIGGSWSMTDTNATATAAFTITRGTVSLPSGIFSVGGSFRNNGGTVTHNTSEIVMRSGVASTLKASSSSLYAVTLSGTGPFTMSDANLTLLDDFRMTQGSATLATNTLSVGGSFVITGGTFAHASGTVLFNATASGKTINPRTSSFYNVVFGSGSGGWTITNSATTTRNLSITTASSLTVASSTRLYVGNVFTNSVGGSATTWTGSTLVLNSGSTYSLNTKSAGGDNYQTLRVGANTDVSMWNSKATTTVVNSSGSLYSQDHNATDGSLYIYGDFHMSTSTKYWSYATDFDGTVLGGSSRDVTVSILANATSTLDGGTLFISGTSGHETTIQNQGSGTYAFRVTSGSLNALYYRFRNLDVKGLKFTGAPTVYSLSSGDFVLAVAGGSLITLSSTTLNANASLVISGDAFATTTAITGKNVTLLGTTSNAWTFVTHTGNLDGEVYDTDGASACGSIRWSDSSCLLTQQTHYRWRNDDGAIGAPNTEWFNSNWDARQHVRLENLDATTYTNAVVKLHVTYDGDMQTDFDDLRFTDASGTTTLKHFVERYIASTDADVWVKVPSLASLDTTTIFMYYKNATASSTSSSTRTFIVADDFEDGNKTEYSGDTSLFTVDGTFAYGGSYGIDATGQENARATDGIGRTDVTVSQGQIIRYLQYIDTSAGSGDEACTMFAVQSPVTSNQNYAVCLEQFGTDRMSLVKNVVDTDSSGTLLASTSVTYTTGWYEVEIDWQTNNRMDVTLTKGATTIATTTATNATYTSGGIGFTFWFQNGGWDNYTSRTRVVTEPAVRFGAEQADGGASWKAAVDTAASFASGDIARLRVAVENTGLQIANRTFDIEYADKSSAPSCEAVSSASYVHVPVQASCGSSPICMQSSTYITDGGAVTDLLVGPEIDFTLGKVVENPSYTTSAITLNQNVYTELEYAITPTVNATQPSYCLRVTNAGTPVDTYLKVAELQLRYNPTVTAVSLNGGSNITLSPGATTSVSISGTATDLNGYADMILASSTIYRSGAGAACSANNNSCYISRGSPKCTFSSCSGNSCTITCNATMYYHADATDNAPYAGENWLGFIEVKDQAGAIDIGSAAGVELLSLRALNVSSAIAYGSLAVSSTTGAFNPTTTIQNIGNSALDISLEGTNLSDGLTSTIPTSQQKFATSSFTYSSCVSCRNMSTTTIANYEVDLSKPTSTSTPVTDLIYWGISIPFGVASNPHSGVNTFYAVGD